MSAIRVPIKMVIAVVLALCAPVATALSNTTSLISFEGHWHVDLKRSVLPRGAPLPKSVTLNVITDDGKSYEAEETQLSQDGTTWTQIVRARVDGNFYQTQSGPVRLSTAITQRTSDLMRLEISGPDGFHGVETCKISDDRKTILCDVLVTFGKDKKFGRSVYVRD